MHNMTSEFAARLRHASRTKDPSLPHSIARETAEPLLRRTPVAWPRWVEAGLVIATIGALLPWFDRVAGDDLGRDRRFADTVIAVRGLPDPLLPSLCSTYGGLAEPIGDTTTYEAIVSENSSFASASAGAPLISMDADRAARKILVACRRGQPSLTLTVAARGAIVANALFPNLTGYAMKIVNRVLPGAAGEKGSRSRAGSELPRKIPRWMTGLADRATQSNNENATSSVNR